MGKGRISRAEEGDDGAASDVWRDSVNRINQTVADDLDAAEQLALVKLRRAAQLGTPNVQIEAARKVTFPCEPDWYREAEKSGLFSSKFHWGWGRSGACR